MQKNKFKFLQLYGIYLALICGYFFLYVVDVDLLLHPNQEPEVGSSVEFIYQQF